MHTHKTVFLIRSLGYGGAERQLVALAKGLHERGHSVVVVVFYSEGPLEMDLHEAGVPVRVLDKQGRWDMFGFLLRLVRLLRREKPDLLHGYLEVSNILVVLLKPIFPRTRMIWGVRMSNVEWASYDWFVKLLFWLESRLARFADLIIVNSHAGLRQATGDGYPREMMRIIPNGIDTDRFQADPTARARVRAEWDIVEDEILIGLVGRLHPMKDHPTFLRAAALLARERKDVRFVCVGEGPTDYRQELYALGKELGLAERLVWAGVRDDMPAVYSALDIVVSSSSWGEGFPNVIGEAMACGVPCVVTGVGDSAWIVGDTGFVVSPGDPCALAKSLQRAITLKEKNELDRKIVRQRIIENFSLNTLVEQSVKVLEEA